MHWFSVCSVIVCFTGILDKQGMVDFVDWRYESNHFASCICYSEIGWCCENTIKSMNTYYVSRNLFDLHKYFKIKGFRDRHETVDCEFKKKYLFFRKKNHD